MKRQIFLLILLNSIFAGCSAQPIDEPVKLMQIFLLIGQSNMAGRAEIEAQDTDSLANVFLFTGILGKEWEKAANPLNKYSTVRKELIFQKLGPGYTFAKKIAETYPDEKFGLVVNARGGTSLAEWMPGQSLYNEAVARAKLAMKSGELKGILWHQGESDVSKGETYLNNLSVMIQSLRTDLKVGSIPFVAGQLSEDRSERADLNKIMILLTGKVKNCGLATSEGTKTIDETHFDSASQRLMGERYASEMIRILKTIEK